MSKALIPNGVVALTIVPPSQPLSIKPLHNARANHHAVAGHGRGGVLLSYRAN